MNRKNKMHSIMQVTWFRLKALSRPRNLWFDSHISFIILQLHSTATKYAQNTTWQPQILAKKYFSKKTFNLFNKPYRPLRAQMSAATMLIWTACWRCDDFAHCLMQTSKWRNTCTRCFMATWENAMPNKVSEASITLTPSGRGPGA